MCDCNIIKLIKGTKNLQLTNIHNKFDYIYLDCDICKKYEDYDGTNYLSCYDCDKFYCCYCKKNETKEIYIYKTNVCNCDNDNNKKFYKCYHQCSYYCDKCIQKECEECFDELTNSD